MDRHSHDDGGKREGKGKKGKRNKRVKISTGQKIKKKIASRHADSVLD
jgi:hypothetical protein